MQTANHILQAIHKMGVKRIPLTRVYRCLYSEDLYLAAYSNIYSNRGALTPGTEDDTADGMSMKRIRKLIEQLRYERFRFRPSRRSYVRKKNGGKRPLGIPNFTEKLLQEALRLLLDAYYEPRFRDSSHGYRPKRGCHTALERIKQSFRASAWFIEGDIRGCFDNIDHDVLLDILARDIHDARLLNLIRLCLTAGVIEEWQYQQTYSGTPQGGILSPLLSNIYLHELDCYIEDVLIPQYTKGKKRARNPEYRRYETAIRRAYDKGNVVLAEQLKKQRRCVPSIDAQDPNFRRLRYVRYADDFILGFIGSKAEAENIRDEISQWLKKNLHLEMSQTKTLITHARTNFANFLGYTISIYQADDRLAPSLHASNGRQMKRRSANGKVRLGLPPRLVYEKAKRYERNGKPIHHTNLTHFSAGHIIDHYQTRFRGLAEYYKYAVDRYKLGRLKYVMQASLVKTLALKFNLSGARIYRKYKGNREVDGQLYKTLQVEVPTSHGVRILYWGAIPLKVVPTGTGWLNDRKPRNFEYRSDLVRRLQADTCEVCGSHEKIEIHHVRKLSDLKKRWAGRKPKPIWVRHMIAMRRKTLVVCKNCHVKIHAGRPLPQPVG